ncbi:MAG: hypothetical protein E6G42_04580 [Actinobacteria bacterium]|nr:MAG: hypothetical protein E6G42_04580 [Actinomycetota bacterium]
MADSLAIVGAALGGVGILTSGASAAYFRSQARAAHRQADEARRQSESTSRLAMMESNLGMYARFRETRNQFLHFANLQQEWRDTQPRFSEMFDICGGLDKFIAVREAMDTIQDVYFLRKDGCVTDQYWHVWTRTFFRFYSKMPTFLRVFDFAAEEGLLHPEFVSFYRAAIEDQEIADPASAA